MYVSIIIDSFSPTIFSQRKFLLIAVDGICVVTKRGKHMAFTQMFNANSLIKSALKKILDTKIRFIYFFKERTNTREIYRAECHKSYFAYSSQESSCFKDSLHFKIQFLNQSPRNRRRKSCLSIIIAMTANQPLYTLGKLTLLAKFQCTQLTKQVLESFFPHSK